MNDRNFFYVVAVAPEDEAAAYRSAFQRVLGSIRLAQ
jgi:hypothetical protein